MKIIKELLQELKQTQIFQTFKVRSNSDLSMEYDVDVYWGGEMKCNCTAGIMNRDCRHKSQIAKSLSPFQWSMIKKHNEIIDKLKKHG